MQSLMQSAGIPVAPSGKPLEWMGPLGALFTRREAAERLRVGVRTVDNLIRRGELGSAKVGRRILIPEQAIWNLLKNRAHVA